MPNLRRGLHSVTAAQKRPKPTSTWPLYWHRSGYWAKTIGSKTYYFGHRGSIDSPPEFDADALDDYERNVVAIKAGRGKLAPVSGATVAVVCGSFLESREQLHAAGEISNRTWLDYQRIAKVVVAHFGQARVVETINQQDFALYRRTLSKGRNAVTLANLVRVSRVIFRYAKTSGLCESIPEFGEFKEPSRKILRKSRNDKKNEHGYKMFEAEQLRAVIESPKTSPQMLAMVLLGVNAAYGNKDCSELRRKVIKPDSGGRYWLSVERGKTQVERRSLLWPETVAAIQAVEPVRPPAELPEHDDRVFLTHTGKPWVRDRTSSNDEIATSFGKLLSAIRVDGKPLKRPGLSFYALRHTTETIGDRCRDTNALNLILGHVDASMSGVYRERIDDDRLAAVSNYIREWLFG